ncbi:hypothetical protein PoB_004644500 [Plakobranchus ocellatus]|uniref:Uncharacterized protein n=1 Tax=Plakobranchus ocellatus TaxID=259542 RepID=A0AAV4BKD2_9GAST|nr:hypothetical protein PoB_004644500 [Plakobranchus ocellatus]
MLGYGAAMPNVPALKSPAAMGAMVAQWLEYTSFWKVPLAKEPGKRDDIDNSNNNQQQQQQDNKSNTPSGDVSGGDTGKTGGGSDGSEPAQAVKPEVVHHPPGQAAPLMQRPDQESSKGSKVIPTDDKKFIFTMAAVLCVGFVGLMMAGVCYYK